MVSGLFFNPSADGSRLSLYLVKIVCGCQSFCRGIQRLVPSYRTCLRTFFTFFTFALSLSFPAQATDLSPVSPFEPERGATRLELSYDFGATSSTYSASGFLTPTDPPALLAFQKIRVSGTFGITPYVAASLEIPFRYASLNNENLEQPVQNQRPLLGDSNFSLHWRFFNRSDPFRSLSLFSSVRLASGAEMAGATGETLISGTGVPAWTLGMLARSGFIRSTLDINASATLETSAVVGYAQTLYTDGSYGDARFHPGNHVDLQTTYEHAVGRKFHFGALLHGRYAFPYAIGPTQSSFFAAGSLPDAPDSNGFMADGGLVARINFRTSMNVLVRTQLHFFGNAAPEFHALGLATFSPFPGWSAGFSLQKLFKGT